MKKLLDWIKNHTGVTILICVLLFVIPLVAVHILFKIPAWSDCLAAEWSAGELLAYIAGFEALAGTVFLGLITVYQTEQANTVSQQLGKENNEMQKIMAQKLLPIIRMEKARLMPVVSPNACPENFPMATQFRRTGSFHSSTPSEIQQNIYINIDINTDNDEPVYVTQISCKLVNISDTIIRHIGLDEIVLREIQGKTPEVVCKNKISGDGVATLLSPGENVDIALILGTKSKELADLWKSDLFGVCMTLFVTNTSINGITFQEYISIRMTNDKYTKISYGENTPNEGVNNNA